MQIIFFVSMLFNAMTVVDPPEHKFYVSTTEIEFKSDSKTLQITSQLFIDDIELLLRNEFEDIRLAPDSNTELIDSLLSQYFRKTLQFYAHGEPLVFSFLGKEYKNDIVQSYLELKLDKILDQIELRNTLLLSLFQEQQNIVHFKTQNKRKSFLLHKKKPSVLLVVAHEN